MDGGFGDPPGGAELRGEDGRRPGRRPAGRRRGPGKRVFCSVPLCAHTVGCFQHSEKRTARYFKSHQIPLQHTSTLFPARATRSCMSLCHLRTRSAFLPLGSVPQRTGHPRRAGGTFGLQPRAARFVGRRRSVPERRETKMMWSVVWTPGF